MWNPSRSCKVSKDSDCSLVSSKNFSEILPPNGWCSEPGEVGQGGLKVLHLWHHSRKTRIPKQKYFFRVQTRRLATSFEIFTGSVEHTGPEKFPHKATCVFFRKSPKAAGWQRVNQKYYLKILSWNLKNLIKKIN